MITSSNASVHRQSLWRRARDMAQKAPPERNRYVDFLRALSILAVVIGHWLVAAPYMKDGAVVGGHLLNIAPWTRWLTLGFQVMPIFFLVGGFSNAMSWDANRRNKGTYSEWFTGRMQRLVNPVLPLVIIWTIVALIATAFGVSRNIVQLATQLALIPVWFLAVYLMVAAIVPLSHAIWCRLGIGSFLLFVAGAIVIDVLKLYFHVPYVHFANFAFVWLAVHQLGYAWQSGHFARPAVAMIWAILGAITLALLIHFGPYPVAMIGVPGEALSNSMPPTLALLALGVTQTGIALALEPSGRRLLDKISVWTATVLINGMIMTIYLWHLTAFVLVMIAAWLLDGAGLSVRPGVGAWWLARPLWFALYIVTLLPLIVLFAKFERASPALTGANEIRALPLWRLISGLILICVGLGATAAFSIASPLGVTGVRLWIIVLPFMGAALIRFGPAYTMAKKI